MKLATGVLLNVWLVFAEPQPSSRSEKRQVAKTGNFRRPR